MQKQDVTYIGLGDIFRDEEIFRENDWIDAVVLDFTSNDLLKFLEGHYEGLRNIMIRNNGKISSLHQRDSRNFEIPIPRHDLFLKIPYSFPFARNLPFTTILTDYGCSFNCPFCIYGTLGFKLRTLSNVIAELDYIHSLNIRELFIKDQSFGTVKNRTYELCKQMKQRYHFSWTCLIRTDLVDYDLISAMKSAGCHTIMFGVESINEKISRKYKNGINRENIINAIDICKSLNIDTVGLFILGFPEEDADNCRETIEFSLESGCSYASFNLFVPKLKTPIRKEMIENNQVDTNEKIMDQSGIATVYRSPRLSSRQLIRLRQEAIRKFYFRPSYVFKRLSRIRSLNEVKNIKTAALKMFTEIF